MMVSAVAAAFAHEKSLDLGSQHTCTLHALTRIIKFDVCGGLLHDVIM